MNVPSFTAVVDGKSNNIRLDPGSRTDIPRDDFDLDARAPVDANTFCHSAGRISRNVRYMRKLLASGSTSMTDCEIIQMVLYPISKNQDVCHIAAALLTKFHTFGGVVNAPEAKLMTIAGMNEIGVAALRTVAASAVHLLRKQIADKPIFYTSKTLTNYLISRLQHERTEVFFVLYLNSRLRLLGDEILWRGTLSRVPCYPREVIRRCLELDAAAIVIAHNHPSGDLQPSGEDVEVTQAIADAANYFDIVLQDHIVVGDGETLSFREHGLIW